MATTHTNLTVGKTYAVTSAEGCTVTLANGVELELLAGQDYFTPDTPDVVISDDDATLVLLFNHAPGRRGSGGNIESDLNVGHGAADAVAAVCTLTLGDLGTGGTLTDSNGQSVELDAPQAYATGQVDIADATEAGTIAFGTHEAVELAPGAAVAAYGSVETGMDVHAMVVFSGGAAIAGSAVEVQSTLEEIAAALNADTAGAGGRPPISSVVTVSASGNELVVTANETGAAGNVLSAEFFIGGSARASVELGNGADARTPQDVVDILNASEDCPAVAVLDADEGGITFTAKEYGVNDTITITGDLFENQHGMSGGHGDYTVDELLEAISGEFTDITAAAGPAEGTITLTANTAGKAANTITYTATGCFGSGTTRQGSTTRGKDAVEQTQYGIFLNGEPLDVEPAPSPTALTPTTAMRNSGVYTVAADIDATALPALPANATAEIWVQMGATALNVQLPPSWVWVNGAAADMTGKTHTTFCITVRNDGVKTLASITYSYDTTPAQS